MHGRRYSCTRYAPVLLYQVPGIFSRCEPWRAEAIGVGIKNFLRISFVASLAHCHFALSSLWYRRGNEISRCTVCARSPSTFSLASFRFLQITLTFELPIPSLYYPCLLLMWIHSTPITQNACVTYF